MTGTGAWVCKYICVKAGALWKGCEGDCYHFTHPRHVRSTEGQVDTSDEASSESGDSEAQQQGDNTNNIIRNQ